MKVITIGRDEGNDVVVNDPHASRNHLQIIQHDDGHFSLSDFGSTNGTYVNGQKISGEITLNDMDIVRIGNATIPWRMYFDEEYSSQDAYQSQQGASMLADQEADSPQFDKSSIMPEKKVRHGFVSFRLWLGIVINVISIPVSIMQYSNMSNLGYVGIQLRSAGVDLEPYSQAIHPHILILQLAAVLFGICNIVFYSLLLKWKKFGFWGLVGVSVVGAIVNMVMMNLIEQDYLLIGLTIELNPIMQLIVAPLSVLVLWAILQIKKNDISCWKHLK